MLDNDELERVIRLELSLLAQEAPTKLIGAIGSDRPLRADRERRRWLVCIGVVAAATAIIGAYIAAFGEPKSHKYSSTSDQAQCASMLRYDNSRWSPIGETFRMPLRARKAGQGSLPACDDGLGSAPERIVSVYEAVGLPEVLIAEDVVWSKSARRLPAGIRMLRVPPSCGASGDARVTVESAQSTKAARFDGDLRKPLTLVVRSEDSSFTGGYWEWLRATVVLPVEADATPEDVYTTLKEGTPARMIYHCDDQRFVVDTLEIVPGSSAR